MLSRAGHRVGAVEQDEALVEHASQQLDALVMQGNGASPKVLREAGSEDADRRVGRAGHGAGAARGARRGSGARPGGRGEPGIEDSDLLVAVTSTDEVNIVACLAAKAQGVARTVARVHSSDYYDKKEPFARDLLGIDLVISTEHMAAKEIRESLLVPGAVNVESFAGGSIDVVEVILKKGSPAVDRPVREVELPEQSLIVGVVRDVEALVPKGDTVLRSRDHIFLVCRQRDATEVVGAVATDTEPVDDAVILGAGRIGLLLALALEDIGISVKVIEKDLARARRAASKLRKALVLQDEGVSREFLLQERVDKTDAFVAVTGDDRTNLLAAMNARRLGSRMTIAGISRGEFAPLAEALGVDVTVSPRLLAAGAPPPRS